jgi:hypothetical protein
MPQQQKHFQLLLNVILVDKYKLDKPSINMHLSAIIL